MEQGQNGSESEPFTLYEVLFNHMRHYFSRNSNRNVIYLISIEYLNLIQLTMCLEIAATL